MSWGAFGVLLAPRGAHSDSGPHFFGRFPTFGALRRPKGRQKEPQGAQRRPTSCPEWSPRAPKALPKAYFLEISETLIFDDSTVIFMVFRVYRSPDGAWGAPKHLREATVGARQGLVDQASRTQRPPRRPASGLWQSRGLEAARRLQESLSF